MKTRTRSALGSKTGGSRCFRPKEKNTAKLLKIVGMEKFLTLRDEFGGRSLWIPKRGGMWPCGACGDRDRCIYRWHQQGHSLRDLSATLKLHPRTISRILRAGRGAPARGPRAG